MSNFKSVLVGFFALLGTFSATPSSAFFGPACIPTLYNCMCTYLVPCPVNDSSQIVDLGRQIQQAQEKLEMIKGLKNPKEMLMMSLRGEAGFQIPGMSSIGIDVNALMGSNSGLLNGISAVQDSLNQIGIDENMISAVASGTLSPNDLLSMAGGAGFDTSQLASIGLSVQNLEALANGTMSAAGQLSLASNLGLQSDFLNNIGIDQVLIQDIAAGTKSVQTLLDKAGSIGLSGSDLAAIGFDTSTLQQLQAGMSPEAVMGLLQRTGYDKSPLTALGIDAGLLGQIASGQLPPEAIQTLAANAGLNPSAIIVPGATGSISAPSTGTRPGGTDYITIPTSSVPGLDNVLTQARGGGSCYAGGSGHTTNMSPSLAAYGFDDDYSRAASAIFGGESGGNWKIAEQGGYSPARAREVFPSTFGSMSDAEIQQVSAQGDTAFFETIYGPGSSASHRLGNTEPGDGYTYRGRSWLQLTGRDNYQRYAEITGHDIVSNPDLLITDSQVSADVTAAYLADRVDRTGDPVADVRAAVSGNRTGLGYSMNINEDRARYAALGGQDPSDLTTVYGESCSATPQSGPFPVGTPPAMCLAENLSLISTDIPPNAFGSDVANIDLAISSGTLEAFPEAVTEVLYANVETAAFGFSRSVTAQNVVVKAMMNIPAFEQMLDQTTTLQEDFMVYDTIQAQLMTAKAEVTSMLTALVSSKAAGELTESQLSPVPLFPQNSRFEDVIEGTVTAPAEERLEEARKMQAVAADHSTFTRDTKAAVHNHNLIKAAIPVAEGMPAIVDIIQAHEDLKIMQFSLEDVIKSRLAQLYANPDAAWEILRPELYAEAGGYLDQNKYAESYSDAKRLSQMLTSSSASTIYGERLWHYEQDDEDGQVKVANRASETPYAYTFIDGNGAPFDEPYRITPRQSLLIGGGGEDDPYMPKGYEMVGSLQYYLELLRRTQFYAEMRRGDALTTMTSRFWNEMVTFAPECIIGPIEFSPVAVSIRPDMFDLSPDCAHLVWQGGDEEDFISGRELGGADASLWTSKITLARTQIRTGGAEKVARDLLAVIAYAEEHDLLGRLGNMNMDTTLNQVQGLLNTLGTAIADSAFSQSIKLPSPVD